MHGGRLSAAQVVGRRHISSAKGKRIIGKLMTSRKKFYSREEWKLETDSRLYESSLPKTEDFCYILKESASADKERIRHGASTTLLPINVYNKLSYLFSRLWILLAFKSFHSPFPLFFFLDFVKLKSLINFLGLNLVHHFATV